MTIILMSNASEDNSVTKDVTEVKTLTGTFIRETSITNPTFRVSGSLTPEQMSSVNYVNIPELHRFYFVNNVIAVRAGVWDLVCHVDVLMSYADKIKEQTAIIKRQQEHWNLYLNDGSLKIYQNPVIITRPFPKGFDKLSIVMAVAGGADSQKASVTSVEGVETNEQLEQLN